jgi:ligand-binding SRPBCC domain-containing protein
MSLHTIKVHQKLPVSLDKIWDFLSSPENLSKITPSNLGFKILSESEGEKMYAGMIINYKIKPIFGIPVKWVSEITHTQDLNYFVDEQRFGPYKFWHHKHFLKMIKGVVEIIDIVHYKIPFWFFGDLFNFLFIRKRLENIFDYRYKKLEEIFGTYKKPVIPAPKLTNG